MDDRYQHKIVNRCLWIYALLVVFLTAISWGVYLGEGRPALKSPFFKSADRFKDLTSFSGKVADSGDGAAALAHGMPVKNHAAPTNYPAPAAYVYAFWLRGFPRHPVLAYLSFLAGGAFCLTVLLWRKTQAERPGNGGLRAAILATSILGLPLMFTADRANMEGVVWLMLATGLALFAAERYYMAAIFIGLATCIKPFPVIFLLLLVRKRRYREAATGLAVTACTVILATLMLGPTTQKTDRELQPGAPSYFGSYVMTVRDLNERRLSHSILDSLKSVASGWKELRLEAEEGPSIKPRPDISSGQPFGMVPKSQAALDTPVHSQNEIRRAIFMRVIFLLSLVLDAIGLCFVLIRIFQLPVVNQMILLGVSATLFPFAASEYTLLYLYVPFGFLLIFLTRDVAIGSVKLEKRQILVCLCLFALLFSPLSFTGRFLGSIQTVLLVVLLFAAARIPMPNSLFREAPVANGVRVVDAVRL